MQSDTPRTDAEAVMPADRDECIVTAHFARELERELAAAIKHRDGYLALLDKALSVIAEANKIAAQYKQERDEAQEEVCRMVSDADQSSNPESAKEVAERRGWDCFKDGGGA